MPQIRGLSFPDELLYDIESNVWARLDPGGDLVIGVTSLAGALAGDFVIYTPKPVGQTLARGRACALLETGKTVGAVRAPVGGVILAHNTELERRPILINRDPYGLGWLLQLRPSSWLAERDQLTPGDRIEAAVLAQMDHYGYTGAT